MAPPRRASLCVPVVREVQPLVIEARLLQALLHSERARAKERAPAIRQVAISASVRCLATLSEPLEIEHDTFLAGDTGSKGAS